VLKTSLAHAKAHLSALVDQAEHKNKRILILRHGKPGRRDRARQVTAPTRKRPTPMRDEDAQRSVLAFVDEFSAAEPEVSAVEDLACHARPARIASGMPCRRAHPASCRRCPVRVARRTRGSAAGDRRSRGSQPGAAGRSDGSCSVAVSLADCGGGPLRRLSPRVRALKNRPATERPAPCADGANPSPAHEAVASLYAALAVGWRVG
jgi:hypothetical protein